MDDEEHTGEVCIHACSWGCGRKYDIILTQIVDASTLMLCIPCMLSFSRNVAQAMVEADSGEVREVLAGANLDGVMLVTESDTPGTVPGFSDPKPADDEFAFDGM